MRCQTCGDATSPEHNDCQRCNTPLGQPAVWPAVATYRVRGIGLAACIAVGVAVVLSLVTALDPIVGLLMTRRAQNADDADLLVDALSVQALLSQPSVVVFPAAAVLVIVWMWRARKNIDAFPGALPTLGAGWAIAGWLIPFVNLVVPARVMASVARDSLWRRRTPATVFVWWITWLVFSIGEGVVSNQNAQAYIRLPRNPSTDADYQAYIDHYGDSLLRNAVPAVACVVAGVTLILLIRRISAAQEARIASGSPAWPTAQAWPAAPVPGGHPAAGATPSASGSGGEEPAGPENQSRA
ncbi:hypothetical protein F4558_004435 [Micromonospora profundi]|uniref:DUF4328 domain-containing protein n=1 Tax=Micromonospora profundi TaxID=1420889 RepID=UPI00143AF20C|nr:DUF4328 domain-containing protein [Micromonospora profundi]NJC14609.1 hypothetical protein [Micromonospora profundi]